MIRDSVVVAPYNARAPAMSSGCSVAYRWLGLFITASTTWPYSLGWSNPRTCPNSCSATRLKSYSVSPVGRIFSGYPGYEFQRYPVLKMTSVSVRVDPSNHHSVTATASPNELPYTEFDQNTLFTWFS